jgi:predicted dehydrogenase
VQAGKHVYCEKPLTHTVWEARTLTDAARKAKRVTQMGTQIHSTDNYRRVVELIRSGAIGAVKEVHVFMDSGWSAPNGRPSSTPPVPSTLDYDLWLGPAEPWPYHPTYLPENWRSFWNFGNGKLGDMACHHVDLPYWALGLKYPTQVTPVEGPKPHPEGAPEWLTVRWDFAASDSAQSPRGPVSVTWYGGSGEEHLPDAWDDWQLPKGWRVGNVFVGDKGILYADYNQHGLRPEKAFKDFQHPAPTIARSVGHHREWVTACKAGDPHGTLCNFDYSGPLAETVLLGCAAYRAQSPLQWDAANLRVTNTREADRFLRRQYRKGWEINA